MKASGNDLWMKHSPGRGFGLTNWNENVSIAKVSSSSNKNKIKRYRRLDEIKELLKGFEAGTLPRREFTHRSHLIVALWYLIHSPATDAINRIRGGIQRYNAVQGTEITKKGGYHETMTLFWISVVRRYLTAAGSAGSLVDLANGLVACYGDKNLPFERYSRELLMSWQARHNWVEPL